ncbi:MAG TPA: agmatinase [Bacteroidales bacterium]|nr:agmatinase [Bacteroidales bacterium]
MIHYGGFPEGNPAIETSPVVILPVPYDGTSTWVKGADKGPEALLHASANMELYDIETDSEVWKVGIHTDAPVTANASPEAMVEAVRERVDALLQQKKFVVTLGGEHSVTIGAVQAYAQHWPDLTVLQIDAHSDLRPEYEGSPNNHACVMSRVADILPFVQVGIRSMDVEELDYMDRSRVVFAEEIQRSRNWISRVINNLSSNVYVTIDLDAFDPSVMPSTGTPEPGGLLWYQVIGLLREVNENANIVGFDVVELCPNPNNKAPDFLASKLLYKLLSYKFNR